MLRHLQEVIQSQRAAFAPAGDEDVGEETEPSAGRDGEARQLKTYGFRHVRGRQVRYLFHSGGWREVFSGTSAADAARIVDAAGFLDTDGDGRRLQKTVKMKGEGHRFYSVKSSILEASFDD